MKKGENLRTIGSGLLLQTFRTVVYAAAAGCAPDAFLLGPYTQNAETFEPKKTQEGHRGSECSPPGFSLLTTTRVMWQKLVHFLWN